MQTKRDNSTPSDANQDLEVLLGAISDFVDHAGVDFSHGTIIGVGPDSDLSVFLGLPHLRRKAIIEGFKHYLNVIKTIRDGGVSLSDDRTLSWHALRELNLRTQSDFFDKIDRADVVEFYSQDHIQLFRNLRFLELCSYPVFDVLVNEWPKLYWRDPEVTRSLLQFAEEKMVLPQTSRFPPNPHLMKELHSVEKRRFSCDMKYLSPLYERQSARKTAVGYVATCRVKPA